ncbi:MAG TPA: hypothetical protein VIL88_06770 [Devosia sp.]|jgi:hypothetical protein|uniref:hypothetical protein n=1 Tax=Devosia sp. TaxID=1871048 RepID=UPI002F91C78D
MERQSQILEVEVEHGGSPYRASYFVEQSTIHASIGGRVMTLPLGPCPAADTVRTMLSGYLNQEARRRKHLMSWSHG